jgi:hypothetical protein
MIRRRLLAALVAPMALGCGSGRTFLGYTTHGMYPDAIRTIAVPVFKNDSLRRDVEFQITEEVVKELERNGFKVVDADKADVELLGTLVSDDKVGFGHDGFINPRGGMMRLIARVRFIDKKSGGELGGGDVFVDPKPTSVSSTETFLIDIVQTRASAEQRAIREMARNIVALLQTPW